MKNELKYVKLFEAFESIKLSKTLKFLTKDGKKAFIEELKKIARCIDFPISKFSDEYFQYLPFKKALELNASYKDEPCDATSFEAFPQSGIEGQVCKGGTIKRIWGRGVRNVTCPKCMGTGLKIRKTNEIKWIKFWFDKDGRFISVTATDGKIRNQVDYEEEMEEINPYTWNAPLLLSSWDYALSSNSRVRDILKNAHFALILNYLDLKNSPFMRRGETITKRNISREGSTALLSDKEIRSINLNKRIDKILSELKIPNTMGEFNKIFIDFLGGRYFGFGVISDRHYREWKSFLDNIYNFLNEGREEDYLLALNKYKDVKRYSYDINRNIDLAINSLRHSVKESNREELDPIIDAIIDLNKTIIDKFKKINLDSLEDIDVVQRKIQSIRDVFQYSDRIRLREVYNIIVNLNYSTSTYYLSCIDNTEEVLKKIQKFKNFVEKI